MRRAGVASFLVMTLAIGGIAQAQEQDFSKVQIKVTKVAGNIYMLEGAGAIDEKKTVEQMKQEKILEPWSKWAGGFVDADKFIETLYNSLTGTKGEFVKHN